MKRSNSRNLNPIDYQRWFGKDIMEYLLNNNKLEDIFDFKNINSEAFKFLRTPMKYDQAMFNKLFIIYSILLAYDKVEKQIIN